jgi:hypothetical protein
MLCAAGNAPADHEATLKHRATLRGKRVLVVEDEVLLSMLVEDELLDAGATVLGPAPSVGDALRLVEEAAVRKQSASPTAGDGRSKGTRASHEPDYSRPEPPAPAGRSRTCSGSPR